MTDSAIVGERVFLYMLGSYSSSVRAQALVKTATEKQLIAISEIVVNAILHNIHISTKAQDILAKEHTLKKLSNPELTLKDRRRIISRRIRVIVPVLKHSLPTVLRWLAHGS